MDAILDEIFAGRDRVSREDVYRHAVTANAPVEAVMVLEGLPAGDYTRAEVEQALARTGQAGGNAPSGGSAPRTGAEQPWDPEDLAVAEGRDPTPENVERARRELAEHGAAAIEKTVP